MAISLPAPRSPRENQAQDLIARIHQKSPLIAGKNPAIITQAAYQILADQNPPRDVFACAGFLIAQYLPIVGTPNQFGFLVPFLCPPTPPITVNIIFLSQHYFIQLVHMHNLANGTEPLTEQQFTDKVRTSLQPLVKQDFVPEPPNTLRNIDPIRAGFATIISEYYQ
jgi:hypothetical protein